MAKVEITGISITHGADLSYKLSITKEEIELFLETGEEPAGLGRFLEYLLEAEGAIGTVEIVPNEEENK